MKLDYKFRSTNIQYTFALNLYNAQLSLENLQHSGFRNKIVKKNGILQ